MTPCDEFSLIVELSEDEGRRRTRYKCSAGYWTIGVGHNLQGKKMPAWLWNEIQADYPHCDNALLDEHIALTDAQIDRLLIEDVQDAISDLDGIWIGWRDLAENRKRALINWSFQCGLTTMLQFKRFWNAMKAHNFDEAANCLQESLWFRQTQPSRTCRVVRQISEG